MMENLFQVMAFSLVFAAMFTIAAAIYEDQIGKFDWLDSQIIDFLKSIFFYLLPFIYALNK